MSKIINRLYEYLDYKSIAPTRFEKNIGLSNGYLGTQLKRNADLGESIINKIIDNCLDLNVEWLVSGVGEMLKSKNTCEVFSQPDSKDAEIAELQRYKIKSLQDEIDKLKASAGMGVSKHAGTAPTSGVPQTKPHHKESGNN